MGFSFLPLHIFRKRASWLKPILGFRFEARNWLQFRPPPAAKMRHRCLQKRQPCFEYPPAPSGRKSLLCLHPLSLAAATYTDIFCHLDCFHPSAGKFLLDRQGLQSLSGIAQTPATSALIARPGWSPHVQQHFYRRPSTNSTVTATFPPELASNSGPVFGFVFGTLRVGTVPQNKCLI